MFGGGEFRVSAGHGEADDGLGGYSACECVAGTDPVADEGAEDGAGDVEEVDDGVPAEGFPERSGVAQDDGEPGGGVDAE